MARVRVLTAGEIGDADLAAMARASGDEMYGVFGHCPEAFKAFLAFYRPLKYGGLGTTFFAPSGTCKSA